MPDDIMALYELTLDQIRERLGREPTMQEWIAIGQAAQASREWEAQIEKIKEIVNGPVPDIREDLIGYDVHARERIGQLERELQDTKDLLWRVINGAPLGYHMMATDEEWHALLREACVVAKRNPTPYGGDLGWREREANRIQKQRERDA